MEAVSYVAGEPWSDHPQCACPVISTFLRNWNDGLSNDAVRTELLAPLIPKLVGTKASTTVELARVMLCIDWICREFTPTWMDMVPSLKEPADALRALKPIQSWEDLNLAVNPLRHAQEKSNTALDTARAVLKPTTTKLQKSALQLIERMIALKDEVNA